MDEWMNDLSFLGQYTEFFIFYFFYLKAKPFQEKDNNSEDALPAFV